MTGSDELYFSRSFDRELRKIDRKLILWIVGKILTLEKNPGPLHSKKLKGTDDEYRLRIGDYRVFYTIDDKKRTVVIYHVAHRREAYRQKQDREFCKCP